MRFASCTLATLLVCAPAVAQQPPPAAPPPTTTAPPAAAAPAPPPAAAAPAPSGKDEFNFELTPPGEQKPAVVQSEAEKRHIEALERSVRTRRRMLLAHQILGFITLAGLAATDIIGTLHYVDKFSGDHTDQYKDAHLGLSIATTATFTGTAVTALFAPNPYPKPIKLDLALLHKVSMGFAAACFLAQVILGPIASVSEGKLYEKDLALAHLVTGWGALGFMGVGTFAYVFK